MINNTTDQGIEPAMEVSKIIKLALSLTIAFIIFLNGFLLYTYFLLQTSSPLDNFRGGFVTPVSLSNDLVIVGTGVYDRDILCKLTDFDIHLKNVDNGEEILIGPTSLAKAPPANLKPGKDIPIEFDLFIPTTLYPGKWMPEFHGTYICQAGIFQATKTVHLQLSTLVAEE